MADYLKAAQKNDLPAGSVKTVIVGGKAVAIANVDGNFFALDDVCTHAGCSLGGEGFLEGDTITCSCHGSKFDVKSGKVLALPATVPVNTYPVKVEGEDILIAI